MLAAGLGVQAVFVGANVNQRMAMLHAGEGDIVVHLPVSTEFAHRALLSCPYARVDVSLFSPGRSILRRPADLADRSVDVLIGSGAQLAANKLLPDAGRQVLCPTHACLSEALAAGRVDAVVLPRVALASLQRNNLGLALTHRFVLARSQGRLGVLSESLLRLPMPDLQIF